MSYTPVKCAYDQCCTFEPASWNQRYCPEHRCKRKAENDRKRLDEAELFDDPRQFKTLNIRSAPDGYKVIIINDTQRPFHDKLTLAAVEHFWGDFKPDLEVYNGDIADFYTISDFNKNPSRRFTLADELHDTRKWLTVRATANPDARRVFIEGNHEDRLRRYLWKHASELSSLPELTVEGLLGLEDVGAELLPYMSVLDFLGFRIEHGFKTSMSKAFPTAVARWMALATSSSGLCGHTHRFGVYSWTDSRHSHSYIENGCLCRTDLEYAPFPNWQHAFTYGVVHNNKVHLFPIQIYPDGFRAEGEFYARR